MHVSQSHTVGGTRSCNIYTLLLTKNALYRKVVGVSLANIVLAVIVDLADSSSW